MTVLAIILVLGPVIFVHELGHYLAARFIGVQVQAFSIGFPPKIFTRTRKGTKYSLGLIPFGGFVTLLGENGEEESDPRSLGSKTRLQKAFVMISGVLMNLIFAIIILSIGYVVGIQPIYPGMENQRGVENNRFVVVNSVQKNAPANNVLKKGDIFYEVEGKRVFTYSDLKVFDVDTSKINVKVKRDGKYLSKEVGIYNFKNDNGDKVAGLGVIVGQGGSIKAPIYIAPILAAKDVAKITQLNISGLANVVGDIFVKKSVSENIAGPVGIIAIASTALQTGVGAVLSLIVMISIGIGVINLVPLPVLDGGRILFLMIEGVIRRDIPISIKQGMITLSALAMIMLLIFITIGDIKAL